MELEAEQPPIPEVVHVVAQVGEDVGVVSDRLSNTLMRPLFSATNTRPSLANLTAVGCVSPVKTAPC